MELREQHNSAIEKKIAALYIILLPLKMFAPLNGIFSVFSACATYFDFILHILGFALMLIASRGKLKTNRFANMFVKLVMVLELISFAMAFLLHETLGTIDGTDTYAAIMGPSIYYLHYLTIMFYNIYIFGLFSKEEIGRLLEKLIGWNLVLGYIQIAICMGIGAVARIYDGLNVLKAFRPAAYITTIWRIPLSGAEPASAGCLIGILVLPYFMSKIISGENMQKYVRQLLLWLPIIYFTRSSTCYILVFIDFLIFIILGIRKRRFTRLTLIMLVALCVGALVLVFLASGREINNPVVNELRYLLFEKSSDRGNESTVTRTIPTYINFKLFLEYPMFGVGNGNQVFFYTKFFPDWGMISATTYSNITGVADGGVFIPSLFSGYGIVGVIAFLLCTIQYVKAAVESKRFLGSFYDMFLMSFVVFLVNGFQGDYFGNYMTLFVLCIPFMAGRCTDRTACQY